MKHITFDLESYINYALFAFRDKEAPYKLTTFELRGEDSFLTQKQIKKMKKIIESNKNTIITYNGIKFDEPITSYALQGKTAGEIKSAVNSLIDKDGLTTWQFYRKAKCKPCIKNHIDIMDVARGSASLKLYGSRLGTQKLQDLPYEPDAVLTDKEMDEVLKYCENDNVLTDELHSYLESDLDLRQAMSEQYGINFMSLNGAKIAEKILVAETGYEGGRPERPDFVKYKAPRYIKFKTPELQELFKKMTKHKYLIMHTEVLDVMRRFGSQKDHEFLLDDLGIAKTTKKRYGTKTKKTISDSGSVISPDFLNAPIEFDGLSYKFGIGGLHASLDSETVVPADDETIVDIDYKSLYPSIIIENNFPPKHIGKSFVKVYQMMYDKRNKELKPAMKLVEKGSDEYNKLDRQQNTMKLVLNSSFGKLGERFSEIYDPWAMLSTTLTGQLTLMMVIEMLSEKGFKTFYANTDGITLKVKKKDVPTVQKITRDFDKVTGLEMEYNFFKSSHLRDVNNFINITDYGEAKTKGAYADVGIEKNVATPICVKACTEFLLHGTPIKKTIKKCKDIKQFVSARQVTGGAVFGYDIKYESFDVPEFVDEDGNKVTKLDKPVDVDLPERWEASLTRNKRITKSILKEKEKIEATYIQENGTYLGKVCRWYYSKKGKTMHYKKSGNKVSMTDSCYPIMDLPKNGKLPKDLDYNWYISHTIRLLKDIGVKYDN